MKFYYFSADWCSPCKTMKPLVQEYSDIEYIDVDSAEGSKLAGVHNVRGVPTLVVADEDGKQVDYLVGSVPKNQLAKFMGKYT